MAQINAPDTDTIGNILGGIALAFLLDRVAMSGAVTNTLPAEFIAVVGYIIFAGAAYYGYRQLKKLN
jgi:hypothetical protein